MVGWLSYDWHVHRKLGKRFAELDRLHEEYVASIRKLAHDPAALKELAQPVIDAFVVWLIRHGHLPSGFHYTLDDSTPDKTVH